MNDRQVRGWSRLRLFNVLMALLHTGQGVAILLLSNEATVPVRTSFLRFDEERQALETATRDVADLQLSPLVALFLFISAFRARARGAAWREPLVRQQSSTLDQLRALVGVRAERVTDDRSHRDAPRHV